MGYELKDMRTAFQKTSQFIFRVKALDLHQPFLQSADHTRQSFGNKSLRTMVPVSHRTELLVSGSQKL